MILVMCSKVHKGQVKERIPRDRSFIRHEERSDPGGYSTIRAVARVVTIIILIRWLLIW
jgi:hypothetical protein